jgi:hypothetical protein
MESVCRKCLHRKERDSLKIEVHEWPLPEDPVEISVVIFELKVPWWYSAWRDCRSYLLQDVLKGRGDQPSPRNDYSLRADPHLSSHYAAEQRLPRRICLLSENKPQVNSHYKMKGIAAMDVTDICVANGAKYRYFDNSTRRFVGTLAFDDDSVARSCTYTLPIPELQGYIFRPASLPDGRPPNESISSQSACPTVMSLDEYRELTGVPLGHHIQWANILLQLAMPSVDFRKEVTTLIFLQCVHQAGPPSGDMLREAHGLLHNDTKASDLVQNLDHAVERIKRNWESAQALSLFASITARVLSLNANTKTACFLLLAKIRDIAMTWIHSLRDLASEASTHKERSLFVGKGVEVALVCASTYDVEDGHMIEMLSSATDASILIQAAIVVQQGDSGQDWKDRYLGLLRLRFARLMHRCYKLLAANNEALDTAVKCSWSAYAPSATGWVTASDQADYWIITETRGLKGTLRVVRYDLLSGELLVNGMPVDQAPAEYHTLPLYKTLFGTATVEVMPGTSKGFRFSTKRSFEAHEVQLGMLPKSRRLIVQAMHGNVVIETVSDDFFDEDLPQHFVEDYIHWYNFTTGNVEFRPADDPWNSSSPATWTLQNVRGMGWRLFKDGTAVVGTQTPSAMAISAIFKPLASSRRIHCILKTSDRSMRVNIPKLRLSFLKEKNETKLTSKEFRSMAVDGKQDLDTLVGFKNKLMLKAESGDQLLLLAEAPVVYTKQGAHLSVNVSSTDAISAVHAIRVDKMLDRLVDNGDLGCKFYMAYLHALTSFCLPDRFTHTTGTEQALNILDSSAAKSFDRLSQANVNILTSIAGLSPGRSCYPTDKQVMQSAKWNGKLSFLAQHARLRISVQEIFDQAKQAEFYYPENTLRFQTLQQIDDHLQKRDSMRSSTFRVPGYGAEDHKWQWDAEYTARDRKPSSSRSKNVASMSSLMARGGSALHWSVPAAGKVWIKLREVGVIYGSVPDRKQYRYGGALVLPGEFDNVMAHLPSHHDKLASSQTPFERYSVTIWLVTLAFAESADMELLQMLAMFCKCPDLLRDRPPAIMRFDLLEGKACSLKPLQKIVERYALPISMCPESALIRLESENLKVYSARREELWQTAQSLEIEKLVLALAYQWPCLNPTTPSVAGFSSYINVVEAMQAVKVKFQTWYSNHLLQEYLEITAYKLFDLSARSARPPSLQYEHASPRLGPAGHLSLGDIFTEAALTRFKTRTPPLLSASVITCVNRSEKTPKLRLQSLLQTLTETIGKSKYEKSYASDLESSLHALLGHNQQRSVSKRLTSKLFADYRRECEDYATTMYEKILVSINSHHNSFGERTLQHWPRMSPSLLLQHLAHDKRDELPEVWRNRIIDYGIALTALQRAGRLQHLHAALEKDGRNTQMVTTDRGSQAIDLLDELENEGHVNWNPHEYPEYLLMEVESGIMIRELQQQIASEMRAPSIDGNAVMQLNMGEGKSTVIIPMVAAALADGNQLVRVVVAKPQSKQMAEMLISKFGGLLRRRIYYMPFSRSLQLTKAAAETMFEVLRECRRNGGILLVQPEHILSFRLMAPECCIAGKDDVGKTLMANKTTSMRSRATSWTRVMRTSVFASN